VSKFRRRGNRLGDKAIEAQARSVKERLGVDEDGAPAITPENAPQVPVAFGESPTIRCAKTRYRRDRHSCVLGGNARIGGDLQHPDVPSFSVRPLISINPTRGTSSGQAVDDLHPHLQRRRDGAEVRSRWRNGGVK